MSVTATTYRCDWPGCGEIAVGVRDEEDLAGRGWEGKCVGFAGGYDYHACPFHRHHTSDEFADEIEGVGRPDGRI